MKTTISKNSKGTWNVYQDGKLKKYGLRTRSQAEQLQTQMHYGSLFDFLTGRTK